MQRFISIFTILPAVVLFLACGFQTGVANEDSSGPITQDTEESVQGPLDGLSFRGALGPEGKARDIPDIFVFENGTFVSKECELRCQYPARPYFVRINGSKTEFISETQCPYKDASIVWRGTIEGDQIRGKSTWVVKRWYWTVEDSFEFEGKLMEKKLTSADTD